MSDERDLLSAELALRLLDGAEHDEARRRAARDPGFAAEVARWEERLQPLADALPEEQPGPGVWAAIARATLPSPAPANDNASVLNKRLKRWRAYGAGMTALAASLAAVLGFSLLRQPAAAPDPAPQAAPAPNLLMATMSSPQARNSASVTYDASRSTLFLTPGYWPADPTHDHVIWVIPPAGDPVPIGACCQRGPEHFVIPAELRPHFGTRSGVAVSVEPLGGPVAGKPGSSFVVRGELRPI